MLLAIFMDKRGITDEFGVDPAIENVEKHIEQSRYKPVYSP